MGSGVTGLLTVNTITPTTSIARPSALMAWFDLIAPRLGAQSGGASGSLTLNNLSSSVVLSGTHNAGSFQLSGAGGYSASATASGSALSGSVTTPLGSGTVGPISSPPAVVAPPSNPNGEYAGTYSMTAQGYYLNQIPTTGAFSRNCARTYVITGTLTLKIDSGGRVAMSDQWREASTIIAPCPDASFSENVLTPPAGSDSGGNFIADVANMQLADVDQFQSNGGTGIRTMVFIGGFSGASTLQGRFLKTFTFAGPAGTTEHREGYPTTETTVTLQKR